MGVTATGAAGSGTTDPAAAASQALKSAQVSGDQFLKLLILQLQNQDPMEPMKNDAFLSQMAQFQSLQEMMSTSANTKALLLSQQLAAASNLIGKYVVVEGNGQQYVGQVDRVTVDGNQVSLVVGNTAVGLDEIKEVRNAP